MNFRYQKDLFPTKIYHINVKGKNQVFKNYLIPKILDFEKYNNTDPPEGWLTNKLKTSFDKEYINTTLITEDVCDEYSIQLSRIFGSDLIINFDNFWYNYYHHGEFQEYHTHLSEQFFEKSSMYSGIHFLSYNSEIHSPVNFLNPIIQNTPYDISTYYPEIEEGDIIIFPSYLQHSVRPGPPTPEYPRITVAFNFDLKKREVECND